MNSDEQSTRIMTTFMDYSNTSEDEEKTKKALKNIETDVLEKVSELSDLLIVRIKMLRISDWVITKKVTKYVFLRELINRKLDNR